MIKYYTNYTVTNTLSGKIYKGAHETFNLDDHYFGSGDAITAAIKKYGKENFSKVIDFLSDTQDEMYELEASIVTKDFIKGHNYNMKPGGRGGYNSAGTVTVKDEQGNYYRVSCDDDRYLSGELVHMNKGMLTVKDKDGITSQVSIDDVAYLSGEFTHINKGMVAVKDKDGITSQVSIDDERYLSGELVSTSKGMTIVKDRDGNCSIVSVTDPRYLSGELVGCEAGTVAVKDKDGNISKMSTTDERYLSGEYVHHNKDKIIVHNKEKKKQKYVDETDEIENGWEMGKLKRDETKTCPHCKKTGGIRNMTRYHFDNCKLKELI